jgi:hypothetical protein
MTVHEVTALAAGDGVVVGETDGVVVGEAAGAAEQAPITRDVRIIRAMGRRLGGPCSRACIPTASVLLVVSDGGSPE